MLMGLLRIITTGLKLRPSKSFRRITLIIFPSAQPTMVGHLPRSRRRGGGGGYLFKYEGNPIPPTINYTSEPECDLFYVLIMLLEREF